MIIIFLLTVIILGSVLVYLSINNISNYKELTEKRISEQERLLAKQFSSDFQNELEGLIANFNDLVHEDSLINIQQIKNIDTIVGIKQTLVLNENGVYLWPHFVFANVTPKNDNSSLTYLEKIKIAEGSEFIVKNYKNAEVNYLTSLKAARGKSDSAYVLNAVSRLYLKMNLHEKAFKTYSTILSDFSSTTNSSGFPYAYFSISQLLNLNDPTINDEVQNLLFLFLTDLSNGIIPLNHSTSNLLDQILEWTSQRKKNENTIRIEELIQKVTGYLTLIDNYKKSIEEIANGENLNKIGLPIGDFNILRPVPGISDEVLALNSSSLKIVGLCIDLGELFDLLKQNQSQGTTDFKYQLELVNNERMNYISNNNLINFSGFSPYFNEHSIKISLVNEYIVEEYVFKRKVLYGIGFILLLGVMVLGLMLMVQNVKREKKMERLRADFVSNVTHELKTPLTSIYMFAESIFLGRVPTESSLKKYANIIIKESENLQRMINNILDFSRKENEKLKYETQDTNLSEIVNSTVDEMNYWLEINKFKVILEVKENVNAKVNSEGIKQALSNLISNAIKYSAEKKKLIIRLMQKENYAWIEVEDFGIGIPKDKLELIFEKFYRVNTEENQTISGTGLGLTVTKDIIEAQNGKLIVQSNLGKGSKFTIILNT